MKTENLQPKISKQPRLILAGFVTILTLVFAALTPPWWNATAQQPEDALTFEPATYQAADGQMTVASQRVVINTDYFEQTGAAEGIQITPAGLALAEDNLTGSYTSGPIRSPLDFITDIGLAWQADIPPGAALSVEARLSEDGESWADWLPVPVELYPTPTGAYAGPLLWVEQKQTHLQFRLTLQADSAELAPQFQQLTLFFNDTSQGPVVEIQPAAQLQSNSPGIPVNICPARPAIISRAAWGCPAGQTSPYWPPKYRPVTHIVVNHTATPNSASDWAAVVRSIWHFHAKILGWGDVGYNYLIDPLGNIYEGRAGGDDVIAAFDGFNRGAMGIGYIGCYGSHCGYGINPAEPPAEMLDAGNQLIAWKVGQKELDPLGEGEYCHDILPTIVGRSQVKCRGYGAEADLLEAFLPDMRLVAQEKIEACELPPNELTIDSVTPASGLNTGQVVLTVTGTGFLAEDENFSVKLVASNSPETALALGDLRTATQFTAIVPVAQPPGLYDLVVTNPGGQSATASQAYESLADTGAETRVNLAPNSLNLRVGQTGQMAVDVANITGLFGVELQLSYDPAIIEVVDADPGAPGTQVAPGAVFAGVEIFDVENETASGQIKFSATRTAPTPPFDGTGSIIQITWRGKAVGQSTVTLDTVKLANTDGQPISAAISPTGSVEVISGTQVIIYGEVQLQGRSDHSAAMVDANGQQIQPNPDGSFEMTIPPGNTYRLTISASGYLSAKAEGDMPPDATELDMGSVTLLGGDVTGDDLIDIFDLALIGSRYGSSNPQADLNADGTVDIFDLTMAAANYGRSGPVVVGLDDRLRDTLEQAGITPIDPGPPPDPAKAALGQMLFFDKILSGNRDTSCSTCHLMSQHTSDGLSVSVGTGGVGGVGPDRFLGEGRILHPRNSPEVFNRGLPGVNTMFWDSRVAGSPDTGFVSPAGDQLPASEMDSLLAALAMFPATARDEMRGMPADKDKFDNELAGLDDEDFTGIWAALTARLLAIPQYVALFNNAYPDTRPGELKFQHAANAIAAFIADAFTMVNTPWDRYVAGDDAAISTEAKQGALLFFGKARCSQCHSGNLLTDQQHHVLAMPQVGPGNIPTNPGSDLGRGPHSGQSTDNYAFRTPPLRNVALTGPWTHAGAYTSLEAVVRHHLNPEQALRNYNPLQLREDLQDSFTGDEAYLGAVLANLDPVVSAPVELTDTEVAHLLAFLNALTDPAAVEMGHLGPESVPSGLPIDK